MSEGEVVWAPSIAGYAGATMLSGVSLSQGFAYMCWFPHENRPLKIAVLCILFSDLFQTGLSLAIVWVQFITCRRNLSYECTVENIWQSLVAVPTATLTTFAVQMFYCYRVWIVSGNNRIITGLVAAFAAVQLILGALCAGDLISSGKIAVLFDNPYLPSSYGASAICDVIISASMVFYLREARTGVKRATNTMQRMVVFFVQMGMLTCLTAVLVAISYLLPGPLYWESLPTELLPKLYVNSMLAVLNARRTIRDDEGEGAKIVVPTIRSAARPSNEMTTPT